MEILVDYDNIQSEFTRGGLFALCTRIGETVGTIQDSVPSRCRVRLYGGWYDANQFTRSAQRLSAEIDETFPGTIRWAAKSGAGQCPTQVEMAFSLEADPRRHLFHTLRVRRFSAMLRCDTQVFDACEELYCPMREVAEFVTQQRCPGNGCNVRQIDVLRKSEQKLVDTMLVSDLVFLATQGQRELVVVSSDDDIWPGIRTAVQLGARVTQLHTSDRETPADYTRGVTNFWQLAL